MRDYENMVLVQETNRTREKKMRDYAYENMLLVQETNRKFYIRHRNLALIYGVSETTWREWSTGAKAAPLSQRTLLVAVLHMPREKVLEEIARLKKLK